MMGAPRIACGRAIRVLLLLWGVAGVAIACNYIGLHDDTIARLWRGFIPFGHYDGLNTNWPYQEADRAAARIRLGRLSGRPQLLCPEGSTRTTRAYLEGAGVTAPFTFVDAPFRNHSDKWTLRDTPARRAARAWLASLRKETPASLAVEAERFQFNGDWFAADAPRTGRRCLTSGPKGARLPAVTALQVPRAGRYHLWVRAMDFPDERPGTRTFTVSVGGKKSAETFGDSGKPGFSWEPGGAFDLAAGPVLLGLHSLAPFARAQAVLLTADPNFIPSALLGAGQRLDKPLDLPAAPEADGLAAWPVTARAGQPAAILENEFVRLEFLPVTRDGQTAIAPRVSLKTAQGWATMPAEPEAEIYAVVAAGDTPELEYSGVYPNWKSTRKPPAELTAEAGGVKLKTARSHPAVIWNAGKLVRFLPRQATASPNGVRLEFYPSSEGTLTADWTLRSGQRAARVRLAFTPALAGEFSLGYHLFRRKPLAEVKEILLPFMWHRHRLPDQPRTLLDPFMPTPVALAETTDAGQSWVAAIIGDPAELPFEWPGMDKPHFGMMIRDNAGSVQPSIYGPVPGTAAARRKAGEPLQFSFRVLAQPGDWYGGYRTAADEVFALHDYRRNVGVSLTEAALNMIDLVMDEDHGGWWERAKAWYQIESRNGSTHAAPLALLSLYRLTGESDIYRRRALPTMEFVLSRSSAHFSPRPQDTGPYEAGAMDGPARMFGTTTFGGFWELSQRRTAAFRPVALPADGIRAAGTYNHNQSFDEWLARYELTGETNALRRACELADRYLDTAINRPPRVELGAQPFFFISFVPDWEGLLHLYETTGHRRYLDAAAFGARQLMTGIWTQPVPPAGQVPIHGGGQFPADGLKSWRGPEPFRLGTPRRPNDTPEHSVPAWVISNVGLGFEQPSTVKGPRANRLIYQMFWAPDFLRLAQYTGERTFETYARNAVIGRWANYPGYYLTGFTDLPLHPRYPLDGPDVTDIYYHHLVPHLAWTIDYLVAEAALRSGGQIRFPAQRQCGYAYFDTRVYGHAPGNVFHADGAWLWLRRGLVRIDNPQINYLTAHNHTQFFTILMNESPQEEKASIRFSTGALNYTTGAVCQVVQKNGQVTAQPLVLRKETAEVTLPPRGLLVVRLDGVSLDLPAHRRAPARGTGPHPGYLTVSSDAGIECRAAALQVSPGSWDAYVWCTAAPPQVKKMSLRYATNGSWQQLEDTDYPFEFSVPVSDPGAGFRFVISGETPEGKAFRTKEATIGAND